MKRELSPPAPKKIPTKLSHHNHARIDNYYWLRERNNPSVIEYLEKENEYTREIMKDTEGFQETLFNEIVGRIKQDDQSVPYRIRGYLYYSRFEKHKEYPVYCRKKDPGGGEEILLDVNEMAKGYDYMNVKGLTISTDNNILAYGVDTTGRRQYTILFKNLNTGKISDEKILNTTGKGVWANDNKTFFYCKKDPETLRSYQILKHVYHTPVESNKVIYEETDPAFVTSVFKSRSEKYLLIGCYSTLSEEFRILSADTPDESFRIFQKRERKHEYEIVHHVNSFFIRTNLDAENFKVMVVDENNTGKENWKEVIPHRENVLVESISAFKNYLIIGERIDGLQQIRVINLTNNKEHYIQLDEEAYTVHVSNNPEFDTNVIRIGYSSMTTPYSTYDYNLETRQMTLLKKQEVIGSFNAENYVTKRLFAKADDKNEIPISLVFHKKTNISKKNPLLLYGYGSYGHTIDPYFSSVRLSLLDRGFVFAIAHVRGSELKGRRWYDEGKLLRKKNTFTDFISCAEFLIQEGITGPSMLFAMGGSAGGLLMGAVSNLRPDLFRGIIASVPFVDVVTTMLDESIPLTTGEYDEWGNPSNKEYYDYMLSYSPYDNVHSQDYPAMLITGGLHDSQVQYWEPAKWVAKIRDFNTGKGPVLLHTNMDAGHGGASGRFRYHKETAMEYAFILKLLNKIE